MSFADNLRMAMRRANISQSELARRLGIRSQAVNQWLQPGGTAPRGKRLAAVAAAIGIELAELLTESVQGPISGSAEQGRADLLAAFDAMDERDRETLLRVALGLRGGSRPPDV